MHRTTSNIKSEMESDLFYLFSDGSCINNGKPNAKGGMGILGLYDRQGKPAEPFFEISAPYTLSTKVTNQRCELLAIKKALRYIKSSVTRPMKLKIISDSMYSINCLTTWGTKWAKSGWKNAAHKPVENLELIKPTIELIGELKEKRIVVEFEHINSHQKAPKRPGEGANAEQIREYEMQLFRWKGNKKVDELAQNASN